MREDGCYSWEQVIFLIFYPSDETEVHVYLPVPILCAYSVFLCDVADQSNIFMQNIPSHVAKDKTSSCTEKGTQDPEFYALIWRLHHPLSLGKYVHLCLTIYKRQLD